MSAFIPLTTGLTFTEWADLFIELFAGEPPGQPGPEEGAWRLWGDELLQLNPLSSLPSPRFFSTWEMWADEVVNSLWNES
jgi:hypothetical protein